MKETIIKKRLNILLLLTIAISFTVSAKDYHVAKNGDDKNVGTEKSPFLTIQAVANIAQPNDIIIVHQGVYREWISPPRGGTSVEDRIVYKAAKGEKVEIKGSEIVKNWVNFKGNVWKVTIPNSMFGAYNPYKDLIKGDYYSDYGRIHHTGEVFMNGKSFWEKESLEKVLNPKLAENAWDADGSIYTWYTESNEEFTTIYANFHNADPNKELVEINVRKACFYPETTGINFITVSGFQMSQAATQWAPPTAEQVGLIGTNWSKGWIIENNTISNSKCTGITLGKYGDEFDNKSANSADGYIETVKRALVEKGWNKENVGSHMIRNNSIFDCGQAGICGSLGGVFSTIENNDIYNIWKKRQFGGPETGGIKFHGAIDMLIKGNRVVNSSIGIWIDWMAQGTRVSGNLCYNNDYEDFLTEVNQGPYLVDNNIFLSLCSVWDMSHGGAYVHNLIAGKLNKSPGTRVTPYLQPHSTIIAGYQELVGGDDRFINNIFIRDNEINSRQEDSQLKSRLDFGKGSEDFGLSAYQNTKLPVKAFGNTYINGAIPYVKESNPLELGYNPTLQIEENEEGVFLSFEVTKKLLKARNKLVTTAVLGKAAISGQTFENPDSTTITIDKDFLGNPRNKSNPVVGPIKFTDKGLSRIKVWDSNK